MLLRRQDSVFIAATLLAVTGTAVADWEVPPSYTIPGAPTTPRDGTVAAVADNTNHANVYGPAQTFARAAGASYSGIGTTVTGATTAVVGTTTPVVGTGRPYFGSSAWLRAGKASSSATVSMEWRTAVQGELYGTSTDAYEDGPMPDSGPWNTLGSDVLHLSGIAATGSLDALGRLPTDAYTLELTFDPGIIVAGYQNFSTLGWTIQDIVSRGELQLGWKDPVTGVWSKGINVINAGASSVENYAGSWASFAASSGANDDNLAAYVGSWGIELHYDGSGNATTDSRIWAVLDHTSMYSVVPAPGAFALLAAAGIVVGRRRRG